MWGGRDVIPLRILNDKNNGFLVNGELMVTLEVDVFAPIGTLGSSQVSDDDDSEWTALDYSSSSNEEWTALDNEEGTALDHSSSSDEEEDEGDVFVVYNGFVIHRSQVANKD